MLLGEREKRQAAEKELEALKAEAKKRAEAEMSELQKAQARIKELEPRAQKADAYETRHKAQLAAALQSLDPQAKERLAPVLTSISDPLDALVAVDVFKSQSSTPTAPPLGPQTERRPPAPPPAGAPKTYREYEQLNDEGRRKYRDIAHTLPE